jgi:hypothetical protein
MVGILTQNFHYIAGLINEAFSNWQAVKYIAKEMSKEMTLFMWDKQCGPAQSSAWLRTCVGSLITAIQSD